MQLNEIVIQCMDDSRDWFPDRVGDLGYLTICMVGETGEFANLVKKGMRGDVPDGLNNPAYQADLAFELTDVLIYLANIAGEMGWDLEELYKMKREKNVDRFTRRNDGVNGEVQ